MTCTGISGTYHRRFYTVCPYKLAGTLVHRYGTSDVLSGTPNLGDVVVEKGYRQTPAVTPRRRRRVASTPQPPAPTPRLIAPLCLLGQRQRNLFVMARVLAVTANNSYFHLESLFRQQQTRYFRRHTWHEMPITEIVSTVFDSNAVR